MRVGMNRYDITIELPETGETDSIKVNCNNVPCAVQKAVVLMAQKTGKSGWRYVRHRLVRAAWDDTWSAAEMNRRDSIEMAKRGIS